MLDRKVVREFLEEELEGIEIPDDIFKEELVGIFCKYVEDDYYDWLKDNFKSFFNHGVPDWKWVREKIKAGEIVPIHTFHPDKYADLFSRKIGQVSDGEVFEV